MTLIKLSAVQPVAWQVEKGWTISNKRVYPPPPPPPKQGKRSISLTKVDTHRCSGYKSSTPDAPRQVQVTDQQRRLQQPGTHGNGRQHGAPAALPVVAGARRCRTAVTAASRPRGASRSGASITAPRAAFAKHCARLQHCSPGGGAESAVSKTLPVTTEVRFPISRCFRFSKSTHF